MALTFLSKFGYPEYVPDDHISKPEFSDNDLFFICDVDLLVKFNTLQRIRLHAAADRAYFPIFFSQYQKSTTANEISEDDGFWRTFSYGMVSMRKVFLEITSRMIICSALERL